MAIQETKVENEFIERTVAVNRVAKTTKGGRNMSFTALVVVGDGKGTVGVGHAKAHEVPSAVTKATTRAKRAFFKAPIINGTIPHPIQGEDCAGVVFLRPASGGTGVIAGGPVRAVLECAGYTDVLTKSLGSSNATNIVHATIAALKLLEEPQAVADRRGLPIEHVAPKRLVPVRKSAAVADKAEAKAEKAEAKAEAPAADKKPAAKKAAPKAAAKKPAAKPAAKKPADKKEA